MKKGRRTHVVSNATDEETESTRKRKGDRIQVEDQRGEIDVARAEWNSTRLTEVEASRAEWPDKR